MANNDDSKSGYTSLKPAQVELSGTGKPRPEQPQQQPPANSIGDYVEELLHNKTALAVAGIIALLIFSFFLLPRLVGTNAGAPSAGTVAKSESGQPKQSGRYEETLAAKREIRGRELVTDQLIGEVAELQLELELDKAPLWAKQAFDAAVNLAKEADSHYQRREWRDAAAKYKDAEKSFLAIEDSWPQVLDARVQDIEDYFAARKLIEAKTAIEALQEIRPDLPLIDELRGRLELYPQLFDLLREAEALFDLGKLREATDKLLAAADIDANFPDLSALAERIKEVAEQEAFQQAMTAGLQAIATESYAEAVAAFRRAVTLNADDAAAVEGLTDAEARLHIQLLSKFQTKARQAEEAERWQEAVSNYQEAQQIAGDVQAINNGLERAKKRLALDNKLTSLVASNENFATEDQRDHGWDVLELSKKVRPKGNRLREQLEQLEASLRQAGMPVILTLQSDKKTAIEIYKLGRFGTFKSRDFELEPGEYTIRGTRRGYRDVLHIVKLEPGLASKTITVLCKEKI